MARVPTPDEIVDGSIIAVSERVADNQGVAARCSHDQQIPDCVRARESGGQATNVVPEITGVLDQADLVLDK